jgi:hypothetical protein
MPYSSSCVAWSFCSAARNAASIPRTVSFSVSMAFNSVSAGLLETTEHQHTCTNTEHLKNASATPTLTGPHGSELSRKCLFQEDAECGSPQTGRCHPQAVACANTVNIAANFSLFPSRARTFATCFPMYDLHAVLETWRRSVKRHPESWSPCSHKNGHNLVKPFRTLAVPAAVRHLRKGGETSTYIGNGTPVSSNGIMTLSIGSGAFMAATHRNTTTQKAPGSTQHLCVRPVLHISVEVCVESTPSNVCATFYVIFIRNGDGACLLSGLR